jgi:short-subunit dehydrogenase
MRNELKPLADQVMVITGASSGIGLATALMAAEKGVKLVLASRNEQALSDICDKITRNGGHAIYVICDVGNRKDVEAVAAKTLDMYGRIDTWINDAGVSIWGKLRDVKDEDHHRLFETNFWGLVYGSLVAAEAIGDKPGAIINLGSALSDRALPIQGMYCASKHAVKGFTDAFRSELESERSPISVTLIKPSAIGTPFVQHAKNYTHREAKLPAPIYSADEVAMAILHAAETRVRDIYVGSFSRSMAALNSVAPRFVDWVCAKFMTEAQLEDRPVRPHNDNLHKPGRDGATVGINTGKGRRSLYTRAALHPFITTAAVATLGLAANALLRRNMQQEDNRKLG